MISVVVIQDRQEIDRHIPLCRRLALEAGAHLPFQHLVHPLVWWDHFNNADGSDFAGKRGTNFLGARSRLEKFSLLAAFDGQGLVGSLPVVEYAVALPGSPDPIRLITLPGDFFISFQDFTVSPGQRQETVNALLKAMSGLLDGRGLLALAHLPQDSPNVPAITASVRELSARGFHCTTALTGRRGGVRPWTAESLASSLRQAASCLKGAGREDGLSALAADLETCPPLHLLFPGKRKALEARVRSALDEACGNGLPRALLEEMESLMSDEPILYPYISLPADPESYLATMGRDTRRYFRRYRKVFEGMGGTFEKVASPDIRRSDIEDHLKLHSTRWKGRSVSIRNEPSRAFHEDLCLKMAAAGCFTLFFARYGGKRVAAHSCVDIGTRREGYMTGRDPVYDHTRAARLLFLETIFDAIAHGFERYDLGLGRFAYKTSFTKASSRTCNFFISPGPSPVDLAGIFLGYECMLPPDGEISCLPDRQNHESGG